LEWNRTSMNDPMREQLGQHSAAQRFNAKQISPKYYANTKSVESTL